MRNVVQLEEEQAKRHETIQLTYDRLYPLWTMLGVPEEEMDGFVNQWTGSTIEVINAVRLSLSLSFSYHYLSDRGSCRR